MKFKTFEEMPVWKKAMKLAEDVFYLTESLPKKEDYGLTSQIRRSSLSIPANIAEAYGKKHSRDKLNFYYHSRGSLLETKNHLIYGNRVGYFEKTKFNNLKILLDDVWKELNSLISYMDKKK